MVKDKKTNIVKMKKGISETKTGSNEIKKTKKLNEGKRFEHNFRDSIPSNIFYTRLIDPAIGFNIDSSKMRFSPKNPYDFIIYRRPEMFCLELKSKQTKSISFAGSSPDIHKHQIEALIKASKFCNAGFVINFRTYDKTFYLPIETFLEITKNINKKSLNITDIEGHGLVIPFRRKKANCVYDINTLFQNVKNNDFYMQKAVNQ